jgi:hypothetical protein
MEQHYLATHQTSHLLEDLPTLQTEYPESIDPEIL